VKCFVNVRIDKIYYFRDCRWCHICPLLSEFRSDGWRTCWLLLKHIMTWWRLGWVDSFLPEGRLFDSCSSRHVGPWASPLPAVACALRRETPIQYSCCNRERLWVVEDLKGHYRNGRNEWMTTFIQQLEYWITRPNILLPWSFHVKSTSKISNFHHTPLDFSEIFIHKLHAKLGI